MKYIITESQKDRIHVLRRLDELKGLIKNLYPYAYPCDFDSLESYMVAIKIEMFQTLTLDWFEDINNDVIWDIVTDAFRNDMVKNYIKKCHDPKPQDY
jgi:hypothetical protein